MKLIMLAITATTLLSTSAASAASGVSDVDFMRANRCRGLASGIPGAIDGAVIDSFVKSESRGRSVYVQQRADQEFDRARRETRSEELGLHVLGQIKGLVVEQRCVAGVGRSSDTQ